MGEMVYKLLDMESQRERAIAMERMQQRFDSETVKGKDAKALAAALLEVFARADEAGRGVLDRSSIRTALDDSGLGFTQGEVTCLMAAAEEDADGAIHYQSLS